IFGSLERFLGILLENYAGHLPLWLAPLQVMVCTIVSEADEYALDVVKDAIGREWTCGTLQLDYVLPERLGAEYVAEDGSKQRPVMLHRAILGSFERFIGIMIENFAGAFPLWLSPVQAVVATITSDADGYAEEVARKFKAAGLRVETDLRNEKVGYKVREHSLAKVPVIAVVGRKEAEEGKVALRRLGSQDQTVLTVDEAIARLAEEATPPDLR
ncbi:MAG TPA: His/Gly/Thr/Pro-type tRNA ligase C-terminal domain-containing protein, partial [Caulobacteraceae bacterium]|nr:His/Gly/Thr/Pro-type tRNA ligase C-terminal domain-containing protein [Caulobacteraceae bacterium]